MNKKRENKKISAYLKGKSIKNIGLSVSINPYHTKNKWHSKKFWYLGWCELGFDEMSDEQVMEKYAKKQKKEFIGDRL